SFITFTRIWFRRDSLETVNEIFHQLGNDFGAPLIGDVLIAFRNVFLVMLAGLVIHWLPASFKERYRQWFAALPLPVIGLIAIAVVFVIYQTVTADMVPFIYFQF